MTSNLTWMLMTDVLTYEKKILPILLPSMVEAENFSDHPRIDVLVQSAYSFVAVARGFEHGAGHTQEK
jgi:hypothetical protein